MSCEITCSDFLKRNDLLYAHKARRKRISLLRITATNRGAAALRLFLNSAKLTVDGKHFSAESPAVVMRKLREFTWDFLLYSVISFHPVSAAIDALVFLSGPLYNRRLRRQLALLVDGDLLLSPGETKSALVAFRGVRGNPDKLRILARTGDDEREVECPIRDQGGG